MSFSTRSSQAAPARSAATAASPAASPAAAPPVRVRQENPLGLEARLRRAQILGHRVASPFSIVQRAEPRGLSNRKFDCFLNAVTQIMAGPYASFFNPEENELEGERAQGIQAAVWAVIQQINAGGEEAVSEDDVEGLRTTLLAQGVVLTEEEQEDAAELMRKLLEPVLPAEESIGLRLDRTIAKEDTEKTTEALGNDPAEYREGRRSQAEATNMIEVEMDRYNSLQAFLYEQFGKGVVTEFDSKNRPKVRYDGQAVKASKVTERRAFTRLPSVLTFYLKRFRERFGGGRERVGKRFDVPHSLFLVQEGDEKQYVEYELAGVVVQQGSLSGGHYWSHVKREEGWRKLDDDRVGKDKVEEDRTQGYLYTFRRVRALSALPAEAQAAQETEPKPGEIDLDAALGEYSRLSKLGGSSLTPPPTGKKSDEILGLPNRKDDCFLLAVIQLMAGSYADLFDPKKNPLGRGKAKIQNKLSYLMQAINKQRALPVTKELIASLRRELAKNKLIEAAVGQEDAAELARRLLEWASPRDLARVQTERSFEEDAATGIEEDELPNNPAEYQNRRSTGTLDTGIIPVEMAGFNSLEGFLYHYYGKTGETVEYDEENRPKVYSGDNAVSLSRVTERRTFQRLPAVLTFALHRFQIGSDGQRVRIDRKFAMPNDLVLEESGEPPTPMEYELVGVVVQRGGLEGGHYYTHRKQGKKWLRADDDKVTESPSLGADLNEGYLYTYRRKTTVSKSLPLAQKNSLFEADDLGQRLVYLVATKQYGEALELLSFPDVDVNATAKKWTALQLAVKAQQEDLVRRLLERGADPETEGPEGSAITIAGTLEHLPGPIRVALQLYSMGDYGKELRALKASKPEETEEIDTKRFLSLYEKLSALERVLKEQILSLSKPTDAPTGKLSDLGHSLQAIATERAFLNDWLARFYGIERAGPGGRPDAAKATEPPVLEPDDLGLVLGYLKTAKAPSDKRTPQQLLESQGKEEREKSVQEALTALFAVRNELFKTVVHGDYAADVDFTADNEPWDQKTIIFGKEDHDFGGRLKTTQSKKVRKGEATKAKPESAAKVGILLDSTYVLQKQYEQAWQSVLTLVLQGEVNPKYLAETRAPESVGLVSQNYFDVTDKKKPVWAPSVLAAEKIATQASPRPTIASTALPGDLRDRLLGIVEGRVEAFTQHRDDRGWLPGGVLYFEYSTGGVADPYGDNHCKLVVSHDLQHLYFTCSHYKAYSYRTTGGEILSRPPFYEILPQGPLATAMGISEATSETESETTETTSQKKTAKKSKKKKKGPGSKTV